MVDIFIPHHPLCGTSWLSKPTHWTGNSIVNRFSLDLPKHTPFSDSSRARKLPSHISPWLSAALVILAHLCYTLFVSWKSKPVLFTFGGVQLFHPQSLSANGGSWGLRYPDTAVNSRVLCLWANEPYKFGDLSIIAGIVLQGRRHKYQK